MLFQALLFLGLITIDFLALMVGVFLDHVRKRGNHGRDLRPADRSSEKRDRRKRLTTSREIRASVSFVDPVAHALGDQVLIKCQKTGKMFGVVSDSAPRNFRDARHSRCRLAESREAAVSQRLSLIQRKHRIQTSDVVMSAV